TYFCARELYYYGSSSYF
nr:immunoglobulin heavy chain junction region [Mus musculus]